MSANAKAAVPPQPRPAAAWLLLFIRPLGEGLFRLVLLAVVGVVLAVLFGLGEYFGVPGLFWDSGSWFLGAEAGLGVGLLFFLVCFIGFIIDNAPPEYGNAPPPWRWGLRRYLFTTWLPLVLVVTIFALICFNRQWPWMVDPTDAARLSPGGVERWPLLLGLAVAVLAASGFAWLFHSLRKPLGVVAEAIRAVAPGPRLQIVLHCLIALGFGAAVAPPWRGFDTLLWCCLASCWATAHGALLFICRVPRDEDHAWKHLLAGASFGLFFLTYTGLFGFYWHAVASRTAPPWWISPAFVLCLLLGLLVQGLGFLRYTFRDWYLGVLLGMALLAGVDGMFFSDPYPLQFPNLAYPDARGPFWDPDAPDAAATAYPQDPVALERIDFQQALADLQKRIKEAKKEGKEIDAREVREALGSAYHQLLKRYQGEAKRPPRFTPRPGDEPTDWQGYQERCDAMRKGLENRELGRLTSWLGQFREPHGPKLVVVAVSGGAARSAFWTSLVLDRLEHDTGLDSFPAHVRLITGASGGMVGAAHWTATLNEHGHSDPKAFAPDDLAHDSLTPVAQTLLFTDLATWLAPHTRTWDRGRALEDAWRPSCAEFSRAFRDDEFVRGEAEGWRPSLVFSPMLVEDGRRLLVSNLYLPYLTENVGDTLSTGHKGMPRPRARVGEGQRYSSQAMEFFHLFPDANAFQLGTAARMSASFAYASPAVDLPTRPRRRVVDAGYYDDYGVDLAADWIYHNRVWIAQYTSGVVLIQIRDESGSDRVLFAEKDAGSWRSLEWLTGPLDGIWSARQSLMAFRNDEQAAALNAYFNDDLGADGKFNTVVFECREKVEMSWRLTEAEKAQMRGDLQSATNVSAFNQLKEWWAADHPMKHPPSSSP